MEIRPENLSATGTRFGQIKAGCYIQKGFTMKTLITLIWGIIAGISPAFSQVAAGDIQEVPFSDPTTCSCTFPEFYFFNRTYLAEAKSRYEPFFVNQDGSVRKATELNVPKFQEFRAAEGVTGEIQGEADPSDRPGIYPGKNWKVRIVWNADQTGNNTPMYLEYRKDTTEPVKRLKIPQGELSFGPRSLFFDIKRNLFFFEYVDGPTGGRDIWLWVFDLKNGSLNKIGETLGSDYFVNPDQKWLVWTDGKQDLDVIGGKSVLTGHVVCYDLDTGKKYRFTNGISIGFFYDWKRKK